MNHGALCNDKNATLDIILCTVYVMHTIVPSATRWGLSSALAPSQNNPYLVHEKSSCYADYHPLGQIPLPIITRKNRKCYSFRQIPGSLSTHNADGNGDIKEPIDLVTKRTTLHVHHAFFVYFSLLGYNVKRSNGTYCRRRKQQFFFLFFSYTLMCSLKIQLQKISP